MNHQSRLEPHRRNGRGEQAARLPTCSVVGNFGVMFTPAGMEQFFEQHAELPPGPVDPDVYRAIAHTCWMEVVGDPLAESDPL